MNYALLLLDVSPAPMQSVGGWTIIILLSVILVLSVAFAAGLTVFMIWYKRKQRTDGSVADSERSH